MICHQLSSSPQFQGGCQPLSINYFHSMTLDCAGINPRKSKQLLSEKNDYPVAISLAPKIRKVQSIENT